MLDSFLLMAPVVGVLFVIWFAYELTKRYIDKAVFFGIMVTGYGIYAFVRLYLSGYGNERIITNPTFQMIIVVGVSSLIIGLINQFLWRESAIEPKPKVTDEAESGDIATPHTESMDINAEEGAKVVFAFPNDGMDNGAYASEYLELGKTYTVDYVDIRGWQSDVYLKEIPDKGFKCVHFADAEMPRQLNQKKGKEMKKETLGFKIEDREGVKVIVENEGGVRPATDHEVALWALIEKQEETLAILRKALTEREEQAEINNNKWIEETKILLGRLEVAQAGVVH